MLGDVIRMMPRAGGAMRDAADELSDLRHEVGRLGALVEAGDCSGPVTTWSAVAEVLGVSHDTVARRRRELGDRSRPYFEDASHVRQWWGALHGRPATLAPGSRPKPAPAVGLTLADLRRRRNVR